MMVGEREPVAMEIPAEEGAAAARGPPRRIRRRLAEGARGGMAVRRLGEVAERRHGGVGRARAEARPGGEGVAPVRVRVWCGGRQSKRLSVGRACLPCAKIQGTRQIGPLPCATIHGTRQITYLPCVPGTAHGKIGFFKSLQIQIQNWLYKILSNEH